MGFLLGSSGQDFRNSDSEPWLRATVTQTTHRTTEVPGGPCFPVPTSQMLLAMAHLGRKFQNETFIFVNFKAFLSLSLLQGPLGGPVKNRPLRSTGYLPLLRVGVLDCPLKASFMVWEVGRALGGGAGAKKGWKYPSRGGWVSHRQMVLLTLLWGLSCSLEDAIWEPPNFSVFILSIHPTWI